MSLKEILYRTVMIYLILAACITAGTAVLGTILDPQAQFGYAAFASPFIFAALGVIPNLLMYSRKELTDRQIIVRKVIQLAVIEAEVTAVCIISPEIHTEDPRVTAGVIVSVLVIFLLVNFIVIMNSRYWAKQLTKELIRFQENTECGGT
ncbi:MAG: hypothetical protein NC078_02225 [Ruminococcus sp.]|nr:hypothetical protein [Ruminococcus sp.]